MTLPAAGPGFIIIDSGLLTECWADVPEPLSGSFHKCREKVEEDDDLGLCEQHRTQLAIDGRPYDESV